MTQQRTPTPAIARPNPTLTGVGWWDLPAGDSSDLVRLAELNKPLQMLPEKRLMMALLQLAIDDIEAAVKKAKTSRPGRLNDTLEWLDGDDSDPWVFSFYNCCWYLDLDADAVRCSLLGMLRDGKLPYRPKSQWKQRTENKN